MIERANDPKAGREGWRPSRHIEPVPAAAPAKPVRPWPFLSEPHRPGGGARSGDSKPDTSGR